jgi:AcrR family transcriptional regulator
MYKRIIETAEKPFYQNGIAKVGVDEIRDKSSCSKTTLYNNYGGKDKLIIEVLKYGDSRFKAKPNEVILGLSAKDTIVKIFEWHGKWSCEENFNGCLFKRATEEMYEDCPAYRISLPNIKNSFEI